ncbi:MAG: hypothetical protein EZS28_040783, partial [Streblomastix strix]
SQAKRMIDAGLRPIALATKNVKYGRYPKRKEEEKLKVDLDVEERVKERDKLEMDMEIDQF